MPREARLDDPLAGDVVEVEQVARALGAGGSGDQTAGPARSSSRAAGTETSSRSGPAQRGQRAAEHAAGVDADRVVDPLRLRHRGVAVDDRRRAAVVARPRAADRQAELVGLARRLAVQGELAHAAGARPW